MRRLCFGWAARALVCSSVGCGALATLGCSADMGGSLLGAPSDPGVPSSPPSSPPPTGSKWEGVDVEGDCGRSSIAWKLVDEMCGGIDDPGYLDALRAPMFRDGAVIGTSMFTVDATHVWVLDVADPSAPARKTLAAGLGHPIGVAAHAGRLLIAAGELGLVIADVTLPEDPAPIAELALPGPALDVSVDGDRALVPMGKSGTAVVDLAPTLATPPAAPVLVRIVQSPGFAVGATASGSIGYIAACETLATVDLDTGDLLGKQWVQTYDGDLSVVPAKDVTLVGNTAYVAAGRYGAVALDVSTPAQPQLIGNCTIKQDLGFYASGVRAQDNTLYVAGGEWGILPIDVGAPGPCPSIVYPALPQEPSADEFCNPEPPWEVLPWQDVYVPPPPEPPNPTPTAGKDPLQTLPMGDVLYAFGDARRLGVRAVDVRSTASFELTKLGRYEEPRLVVDIAAQAGRVLVVGPAGGLFLADDATLLTQLSGPPEVVDGVAATMLDDGRWAFSTPQALHVENAPAVTLQAPPVWHGISSAGAEVVVAAQSGLIRVDATAGTPTWVTIPTAELPPALLALPGAIYVAAPEWTQAIRIDATGTNELPSSGVFGAEEILDANLWREGLPRRLLAGSPFGVVEIASLGARAGLTVHGAGATTKLALPAGTYVDAAFQGDTLWLVLADRNVYRSALLSVKLSATKAELVQTDTFTGIATAVAPDGERLYVADADRGVRVYGIGTGAPVVLGVVELEVAP